MRVLWLAWLVFIVYGSLLPFTFEAVPLAEAWARFSHIRLLDVGLQGRADWVANGVLYFPLGLLGTLVFSGGGAARRLSAGAAAMLLGIALAVAVEFTQLFFPPRTVSLNDLVAETLGCLLGVLIGGVGLRHWQAALGLWHGQRHRLAAAVLPAGMLTLALFSLFPFDLLVSGAELADKLAGGFCGWLIAPVYAHDGIGLVMLRLLAEALAVMPLGAWWARRQASPHPQIPASSIAALGALLGGAFGLLLELGQVFVASGVSQGLSVFSRSLGWGAGAALGMHTLTWDELAWSTLLRRWTLPLLMGCLLAAAAKAGWWSYEWGSMDLALARLSSGEVRWLPFYYHYFTSEGAAVQSTAPVFLLFAPLGVLAWAWQFSAWRVGIVAGAIAAVMESGRLFFAPVRPDPTNALIAAASAAWVTWTLHQLWAGGGHLSAAGAADVPAQRSREIKDGPALTPDLAAWRSPVLWLVVALSLLWWWQFPVYQAAVGLLLLGGAALVWWRPVLLVAVAVAGVPLLNLTIWSGQEYVDEFDVLMLLGLGIAWARRGPPVPMASDRARAVVSFAVALSLLASAVVGWSPWDLAALAHPHGPLSPWYSLRLFKGALMAALLVLVIRRQLAAGEPVLRSLSLGMVLGLAGVVAWVLWERKVFVGLLDFAADYRVAGPVLPMRLGGAYLDVFLVVSLPFALAGGLHGRHVWWRILCAVTSLGGIYTMAVTFTRSTYLAVALAVSVVALGALRSSPSTGFRRWWPVAGLMVVLGMVAYPIVTGPFASARMAVVTQDMDTRLGHARYVMSARDNDAVTQVLGQGLGRFPVRSYWARQVSPESLSGMGVHQFLQVDGVSFLQLGAGPMLYLDQAVALAPGEPIQVRTRVRPSGPGGKWVVSLCEKWLLASGNCASHTFFLRDAEPGWRELSATLKTDELIPSSSWLKRPMRLTVYNAGPTRLDIDMISLINGQGRELVRNGGFDHGSDHWSYASDDHLAWHVKNLALAVWFDLGWLGVAAFGAFLLLALFRSLRAAWAGDRSAQALSAALTGLLVVAVFDSVIDDPRFLLLLLLLLWLSARSRAEFERGMV